MQVVNIPSTIRDAGVPEKEFMAGLDELAEVPDARPGGSLGRSGHDRFQFALAVGPVGECLFEELPYSCRLRTETRVGTHGNIPVGIRAVLAVTHLVSGQAEACPHGVGPPLSLSLSP